MDDKYLTPGGGQPQAISKNILNSLNELHYTIDRMDEIYEIISRIWTSLYGSDTQKSQEKDPGVNPGSEMQNPSIIDMINDETKRINANTTYITEALYRMKDFIGER